MAADRGGAGDRAARMAQDRGAMMRWLVADRQAAGLSQTEVAALMGTSQSAVARLESGTADVRASTLERYAAAIGGQITWRVSHDSREHAVRPAPGPGRTLAARLDPAITARLDPAG